MKGSMLGLSYDLGVPICGTAPVLQQAGGSSSVSPLSFAQEEVWLAMQLTPDIPLYNESVTIHRFGPLDVKTIRSSLNHILRRHEALRTVFPKVDGRPVRVVETECALALEVVDLRSLSEAEQETEASRLTTEQARTCFDLDRGPLLRATLIQMGDAIYRLHLTAHQLLCDSISMQQVLPAELLTVYNSLCGPGKPQLPECPIQYGNFVEWQKRHWSPAKQLSFWQTQAGFETPRIQLPTDHVRPAASTFRRMAQCRVIPPEVVEKLKFVGAKQDADLFSVLLAAFAVLLHRYTQQDEFVLGTIASGRCHPQTETMIGCFSGLLPLRLNVSGDPGFCDFVGRIRDLTRGAASHGHVPLKLIRESLPASRNRLTPPVSFVLNSPVLLDAGWKVSSLDMETGASKFDLELELESYGDEIQSRLSCNCDIYESDTLCRIAAHFMTLLAAEAHNPELRLSQMPMLTSVERRKILVEWNDTSAQYPSDACIHHLVEAQVERAPEAVAIVQNDEELSYRELEDRANKLARYIKKLGVGPERPVGICLTRSFDFAIALLGTLKAGGACLPLDPNYPKVRLDYMLEDSRSAVVICETGTARSFSNSFSNVICLQDALPEICRESAERPCSEVQPGNLAYVIYTSGSTGRPRGVLLTHRGLVNHSTAAVRLYGLTAWDRMLQFSSLSFDIAIEELFPTWTTGGCVVLRGPDQSVSVSEFMDLIRQQNVTVVDLPTAYWHEWVHELSESRENLPKTLRLVIIGGEKASLTAFTRWTRLAGDGVRWINTYGPSEASVIATAYEPLSKAADNRVLPIGRPIANTKVYLLDRYLNPVPIGVPGELHIGGPGLARGYLNRPELTEEKFIRDPFSEETEARLYKTGDLARYLPDGEIEFIGRTDHQVKISGFRIELGEIEAVLSTHPGIREAVGAVLDIGEEKRLLAYVVLQPGMNPSASELRAFLSRHLPEYMVPSAVVMLDTLPMTPNGKVDRLALPAPATHDFNQQSFEAPRNTLEAQLTKMWEAVLGVKPIGIRQNFFELGGRSLLAVRLMHRVELALGRRMPITTLLQAPTIEGLAGLLRQEGWSPSWSSLIPIQPNGSKPPLFCVHGVGGTVLHFTELAKRLGPDQPCYGLQAQGLDGKQPCHTRLEDMAEQYIKEIRGVQPDGPYHLGGYSFGGVVAFEMARQLHAQGQQVGLVALFDTAPANYEPDVSQFVTFLLLPSRMKSAYVIRRAKELPKHLTRTISNLFLPAALKHVRRACLQAEKQYVAKTYAGRVALFRAREKSLRTLDNVLLGWNQLALGGVDAHEVDGDHLSMITEPQVSNLAQQLSARLQNEFERR